MEGGREETEGWSDECRSGELQGWDRRQMGAGARNWGRMSAERSK